MTDCKAPFPACVTSERLRTIYDVWHRLAAGRIGPKRHEIGPSKLRGAMAAAFIVEVIDGGTDFRIGFRGDRVIQFMGDPCGAATIADLRGTPFWDVAAELFAQCVRHGKPLLSGPKRTHYAGKEHLEREILLLPLSEDGETVTALLGALETWQLGTNRHAVVPLLAD